MNPAATHLWNGKAYPLQDVLPHQIFNAIGMHRMVALDARDPELFVNDGPGDRVAVVRFQLGDSGQWLAVCVSNLWRSTGSEVIGARRGADGRPGARFWDGGQFTTLDQIPAAIEAVVTRRGEW